MLYDIHKLLPLVPQDEEFKALIEEVQEIRKTSDYCPSAKYGINISEMLGTIISKEIYMNDYKNVTEYLLEEKIPYETVTASLEKIAESKIFD